MGRSRIAEHLTAGAIGVVLGYLALRLGEIGWLLAGSVILAMAAFYVLRHRLDDAGWLLVGTGLIPATILGQNAFVAATDPSIDVGNDTSIMLTTSVTVMCVGGLITLIGTAAGNGRLGR